MDDVFANHIGWNLEVYVDNMIVKNINGCNHVKDLEDFMKLVRKYDMCQSSTKCSFGAYVGKFLGFMMTTRGI